MIRALCSASICPTHHSSGPALAAAEFKRYATQFASAAPQPHGHRMDQNPTELRPGDVLVCSHCGRGRNVDQSWIETTAKALKDRGLWPRQPKAGYASAFVAAIPTELLKHLTCNDCKEVGAVKLHLKPKRVIGQSQKNAADGAAEVDSKNTTQSSVMVRCSVCGAPAIPGDSVCYTHNN